MKKIVLVLNFILASVLYSQDNCDAVLSDNETSFNCSKSTGCGNWDFVSSRYILEPGGSPDGGNAYRIQGVEYPGSESGTLIYNLTNLTIGKEYTVWFNHRAYTSLSSINVGYWKVNEKIYAWNEITNKSETPWKKSSFSFVPTKTSYELKFDAVKHYGEDLFLLLDGVFVGRTDTCTPSDCNSYSSFSPAVDKEYVLSAWVKEESNQQLSNYSNTQLQIHAGSTLVAEASPQGIIIDGWQQIEYLFTLPSSTTNLNVKFVNKSTSNDAYFDDIRIHPLDGNMKSFVYDPVTQRLMAELDENNYATFYEYDKEGGLVRVKKETVNGVHTIQETRSGNSKLNAN